ncbi:MAG: hypothetical protein Q3972_06265 [Corynebacterium sp.]|nr:hypothetical protein [Corynebacterium sp.]
MSQHYDFYVDLDLDRSLSSEELGEIIASRLETLPAPVAAPAAPVVAANPAATEPGAADTAEAVAVTTETVAAEADAAAEAANEAAAEASTEAPVDEAAALRDKLTTAQAILGDVNKRALYDTALANDSLPLIGPMELHRLVEKGYLYEKPKTAWEIKAAVIALIALVILPLATGIRRVMELNDLYQQTAEAAGYSNSVAYVLYNYSLMGIFLSSIIVFFWVSSVAAQSIYTLLTARDPRARVPQVVKLVCGIGMVLALMVIEAAQVNLLIGTVVLAAAAIILMALPNATKWMQRVDDNELVR